MKILFLLAAGLLCAPAFASEWTEVTTTPEGDAHFYDHDKLFLDGDAITYWRKVEFRAPRPVRSALARTALFREQIDCGARELRTLGYLYYAADGAMIEDVYAPDAPPVAIAEGTPARQLETLLCPLVATAPAAPAPQAGEVDEIERLRQEIEALQANIRRLREGTDPGKAADAAR